MAGLFDDTEPEGSTRPQVRANLFSPMSDKANRGFSDGVVNYAEQPRPYLVPAFVRSADLMTLDPDPDGSRTAKWGEAVGTYYGRDYVAGLTVFGRPMSRDQLEETEAGKALLDIAYRNRRGERRGFAEAVSDWEWSDLPFVGMIASVGGSISDAVTVSDTMKKLQNGESVTDDELIKTRLYMAQQDRESKGTWGATVGGIIRAAPGFMAEIAATGGGAAAVRGGVAKAGSGGIHVAMTRGVKTLARESMEHSAQRVVAKAVGEGASRAAIREGFASLAGTATERKLVSDVTTQLFGFMKRSDVSHLYKGFTDDALMDMARNRAQYEFSKLIARQGGSAMSNGFHSFTQWLGRHASAGLMDFGAYGTGEATMLFTRETSAGRALADALSVFVVEGPIKGSLLMLPKKAVEQGVIAPIWGQDGRVVGQNQLALQAQALITNDRQLMENAEALAFGMDLLEYISENTGEGLKSLLAAGGIGLERMGIKGLVRPAVTAISPAGHALPTAGPDAVSVGGRMRAFVQKIFGSRADYAKRVAGHESELVARRLGVTGAEAAAVRDALLTNDLSRLRPELQRAIGPNLDAFVKETVKAAGAEELKNLQFKTYARYAVAKWMQKHNVGPETVMNMFDRMGYDGVLGEMFEERYSDVVEGLLGLNADAGSVRLVPGVESAEEASFFNNLKSAVKGLYPGWEQLTAEAVGFMVPMVTRGLTMRAMSAIGGGGEIAEIRATLDVLDDAMRHNTVGEMTVANAQSAFEYARQVDDAEIADLESRLAQARDANDAATEQELVKELDTRRRVAERRAARQAKYFESIPETARNIASTLVAVPIDTYGTLSDKTLEDRSPVLTEAEARQVLDAQRTLGNFASTLARRVVEGQLPVEGESEGAFRKIARKLVGVAGFLVTGDFSLAAVNPAQWTARDMGLSKDVVDALTAGFRNELGEVRKTAPDDATAEQMLDEAQRRFDGRARQIMMANLAVHQLRSFTDLRLEEEAAMQWAATTEDADGRRWQHSANRDGETVFFKFAPDGSTVDEATVRTLAQLKAEHKDEIDKVKDDLLKAVVDIMTRRLTGADHGRNAVLASVTLDRSSDMLDTALYDAAMHMIGAQDVIYRVSLDGRTPLKAVMESSSVARVSDDVVDYIASKDRVDDVDDRAVESVAQSLRLKFDGTEAGLKDRKDKVFRLAKLMRLVRREGTLYYSKEIFDEDSDALRLSANGTSTLTAKRLRDGTYAVDFGVRKDDPRRRDVHSYATKEELEAAMRAMGYVQDSAHTVLTLAKVIESSDMFWMIRELGLAGEYYELLGRREDSQMHPMLRRDENGKFISQDEAERLFREEVALARRGADAKPGSEGWAMHDKLYGENGYVKIGEDLLARHGVQVDSVLPYTGEFHDYAPSRYTLKLRVGPISPKSADTYVMVDPGKSPDLTSGLVDAALMQAYSRNGALLHDSLGGVVSEFVNDVRRVANDALADARAAKDTALVGQLLTFIELCCARVDREVVDGKGVHSIKRGVGLSAVGFTTLASAFGLFRATVDTANPMARALATIAPRVWRLNSFLGFESLLNVTLGGNLLEHEVWSAKPGTKDYADPALTGVPRLMALASADADALRKAVQSSLPAGMGYEGFLNAVLRQLDQQSRTGSSVVSDQDRAELRAKAQVAAAPDAPPAAHYTFLGGLISVLKATIDRGVNTSGTVQEFLGRVLETVRNDPQTTAEQRTAAERQLRYLADRDLDMAATRDYLAKSNELTEALQKLAEAEAELTRLRQRLVDLDRTSLSAQVEGTATPEAATPEAATPEAATPEAATPEAATPELNVEAVEDLGVAEEPEGAEETNATSMSVDAERQNIRQELSDATAKAEGLRKEVVDLQESVGRRIPPGVAALQGGGNTRAVEPLPIEESEDLSVAGEDEDLTIANNPEGSDVPSVFSAAAASRADGFTTERGDLPETGARRLSTRQTRLAASVVVRLLGPSGVDETAFTDALDRLFPYLSDAERTDVVAGFRDLDALRIAEGLPWGKVSFYDGGIRFLDESDADDSKSSDNFNERALAEYSDDSMSDFAALARRALSECNGSVMGFVDILRSRVKSLDASAPGSELLKGLLCPQMTPGLKSLAQADAQHKRILDRFTGDGAREVANEVATTDTAAAFLLAYVSSLPVNARTRFAGLCSGAVAATPVHVKAGSMVPVSNDPDGKVPDTLVTDSVHRVVGMAPSRLRHAAETLETGARDLVSSGSLVSTGDVLSDLRVNAKQVADLLAKVLGRNSPLISALTSPIAHKAWAQAYANAATRGAVMELYRSVSASRVSRVAGVDVVDTIAAALRRLAERGRRADRADVESMFLAAFTMGGWDGNVGLARAPMRMDVTDPLLTFLNMFQTRLPRTMMRSEIDQERDRTASSVVVAPRGMIPLLSRWLYQEGEGSFTEICRATWPGVSDETLAECRQDGTWPDDARTPICAKCISSSLTAREVYAACRDAYDENGTKWVPIYSGDHSSFTLLQVPTGVDLGTAEAGLKGSSALMSVVLSDSPYRAKDESKFNKLGGLTRFIGFGPGSTGQYAKDLATIANKEDYTRGDIVGVSVNGMHRKDDVPVRGTDVERLVRKAVEAGATIIADDKKNRERPYNVGERELAKLLVELGYAEHKPGVWTPSQSGDYKSFAKAAYKAIGMDLMFTDAKRSAISSLEAQGTGLVGADAQGNYGEHRVHIVHSWTPGTKNEALLGTTYMHGYGARKIGEMSADPESNTKKVHVVGGGNYLFFVKSLAVTQGGPRGTFREGSAGRAVFDYLEGFRGSDALSTDTLTDDDSYKIGPGNSKSLRVVNNGGNVTVMGYVFDRLVRRLVESGVLHEGYSQEDLAKAFKAYNRMTGDELDEVVGLIKLKDLVHGTTTDRKLSDIMPGAMVNVFEGWSGPALDLSYREDTAMAYTVANVAHKATVPEDPGRCPRNYEVDALAIVRTLAAGDGKRSWLKTPYLADRLQGLVANWGILASAVYSRPEFLKSLVRTNENLAELALNGEFVSEDGRFSGQFAVQEITRQMTARMRQAANLPLQGVSAPLVSAGASIAPDGSLVVHTESLMERDMLKGAELFSDEERGFYGTDHRAALCNVNLVNNGARYGWFLDEDAVDRLRKTNKLVAAAYASAEADARAGGRPGRVHALAIAYMAREVRRLTRATESTDAETRSAALKAALDARRSFAGVFVDHHNIAVSRYGDAYLRTFGVEDLFTPSAGESAADEFDLSAVQCEGQDLVYNDVTKKRHVFLGGTLMGLPRTPSYNGGPWLQVVRAGLPVTERPRPNAPAGERDWLPGLDAMVSPDPYTNAILGCDHDGDKTTLYMLSVHRYGGVQFAEPPQVGDDVRFTGVDGEANRAAYLSRCSTLGFVSKVRVDEAGNEVEVPRDDMSPDVYYRLTPNLRRQVSNSFVRMLFSMARQLPVVEGSADAGSNTLKIAERKAPDAGSTTPRAKFLGTLVAQEMSAFPGGKAAKEDTLKNHALPEVMPSDGSGGTLGDPEVAAWITTSAMDAGDARGVMVSLARTLHMAWALGTFSTDDGARQNLGSLLGPMTGADWLSFMHLVDGISNATFDDVKEQMCGRLGWTKGMMETVVTEFLMWPGRVPKTQEAFIKTLQRYVDDVKKGTERYWMLRSALVDDAAAHDLVLGSLLSSDQPRVSRGNFLGKLGLVEVATSSGTSIESDAGVKKTIGTAIGKALADRLESLGQFVGLLTRDRGRNAAAGLLYAVAVRGLFGAGLEGKMTAGEDNGRAVHSFRADTALTQAEYDKVVRGVSKALDAAHVDQWCARRSLLDTARSVASSILYVAADPGAPNARSVRSRAAEAFNDYAARVQQGAKGPAPRVAKSIPFAQARRMHEATMLLYDVGADLYTCMSRAAEAALNRDDLLTDAFVSGDASAAARLLVKDTVNPGDLMSLRSNQQQIPPIVAFFTGACDDVLSKVQPGLTGERVYDMLSRLASNISGVTSANTSTVANAAKALETRDTAVISSSFEPKILAMRAAVESMCEICYRLMVTSTEFRDDAGARAVAFLRMAPDAAFSTVDDSGHRVSRDPAHGPIAGALRRILPMFRANDQVSLDKVRDMFDRIISGTAFNGKRVLVEDDRRLAEARAAAGGVLDDAAWLEKEGYGRAGSFKLSRQTLLDYVSELTRVPRENLTTLADAERALTSDEDKTSVRYAWRALGDAEVTPAVLFGALLPAYTLVTSQMAGTPTADSASVLACLPRRYYAALSSGEAMRRLQGSPLVPLMVGSVWDVEAVPRKLDKLPLDTGLLDNEAYLRELGEGLVGIDMTQQMPAKRRRAKALATREARNKIIGKDRRESRRAPANSNVVDIFDPAFKAALDAIRGGRALPATLPSATNASHLAPGQDYDEGTAKLALAMGALLGSWARVEYNGGTVFTIRGDLRGDAGAGKSVSIVVDASTSPLLDSDEAVRALANSPAYAASLTEVVDFGITADEFLLLPEATRIALVRRFGVGGATSNKVAWSVDAKGLATLTGRISVPAGGTALYHEYFHAMMRMFESIGLLGDADYEALAGTFGDDPAKRHRFNEEKAAEAFRKWVEGNTDTETAEVRGVFRRILDFLKGLLEALKHGFSFRDPSGEEHLFKMMVHGIAQPSTERLSETGLDAVVAASRMRSTFAPAPAPRRARASLEGEMRGVVHETPNVEKLATLEELPGYATVDQKFVESVARRQGTLDEKLASGSTPDLLSAVRALAQARANLARAMGVAVDVKALPGDDYSAGGIPASVPDPASLPDSAAEEIASVTSPLVNNNRFFRTANSILASLEHGLRESGAWTDDLEFVVRQYTSNSHLSVADENLRRQAVLHGLRRALGAVNPEAARTLDNREIEGSLAYRAALVMYQHLCSGFLDRRTTGGSPMDEAARHASQYQVAAWILSTRPQSPSSLVSNAQARVQELHDASPSGASRAELAMHLAQLDALDRLVGDPTGLARYRRDQGTKVVNDVISALRAGTLSHGVDDNGAIRDITPVAAVPDEELSDRSREHLRTFRSSHQDPAVQESLKLALSTAYQVAAMAKYYGELDIQPAANGDIAEARRLARLNGIPEHMSAEEFLGEQLVGDSNLVDNQAYVDYQCQSHFIAENVDAWLKSMVRTGFGAHEGLGQMMSGEHFEYAGLVTRVTQTENWVAHMLGISLEPGGRLLKVLRQRGEYKMETGEVVRQVEDGPGEFRLGDGTVVRAASRVKDRGGESFTLTDGRKVVRTASGYQLETGEAVQRLNEYVKFDNYGKKTTSVKMTEEDLRRVDLWLKMCTAHANHQNKMVTGVDDLTFYASMSRKEEDYSIDAVTAKRGDKKRGGKKRMNPLEWAIWRMTRQIPEDLLPAVHARFVSAALGAMRQADRLMDEGTPGGPDGAPMVNDAHTYNSFVIGELVRRGLVVGFNPGGSRHFAGGLPRYENAALLLDCDEVNNMFLDSATYGKLTDADKGGREKAWVDRDFICRQFMEVWEDTARFVKRHPWLTHGDGQFFHAFGTALPFWRGSGIFMYNAVRTDRANKVNLSDKLSLAEQLVKRVGTSQYPGGKKLSAFDRTLIVDDVDTLARYCGTPQRGEMLLDAILRGDYEFGTQQSQDTGVVLPADATYADLAHAIYQRAREEIWMSRTGYAGKAHAEAEAIIERYEETRLQRGEMFGGTIGFNDLDMFRMHGTLPANYQIGHKVHKCIDGVTNAMMSRSTLANLLLTPEGSTGAPVYYADPNELAAESSGLPDAFWGNLAEWWQEHNPRIGQVYDPAKSGVQNAKAVYEKVRALHQIDGPKRRRKNVGELGYTELGGDDSRLVSVDRWMVLDGNGDDFMNATCGGEAMGYLKHFLDANRTLGLGGPKARAVFQRALSYSKSLSVSFSLFFPLATRWESPFGAVGALSTIGSNWKWVGDWMKRHPDAANRIRGMFGGKAWITHDYIGMKDILSMMDSNDPFLAELYSWAAALGITVSTSVTNPMEPEKTILLKDIRRLKEMVRTHMGASAAGKFSRMMDVILVRQGDRAFNYVLNATKLAVVAQLCMKLRHQAKARGKAFDPVRDLRKYSRYINAEIGGIDPMQFAWAHPRARAIMGHTLFSWQWTVGAWQAGGGSVITDLLTGSHTMTRQEREYLAGRWLRMFLGVMVGVPAMFQAVTMLFATALNAMAGGGGDDDDTWATWKNEDKARWAAFDLTPLLRAVDNFDSARLGGVLRRFKEGGGRGAAALGAVAGAVLGRAGGGNWLTGAVGGAIGAGAGTAVPHLIPLYTGGDAANSLTKRRRYYMHFGKQGWEFFRWFDDAESQFFSKLSMPIQRMFEGIMGRSLGYLERSLAWDDMGQFERWLSPTTDSALFNLVEAFLPFSVGGMNRNGDAGVLPIFGPVQMGASQTAVQKRLVSELEKWAANDRRGYAFGRTVHGKGGKPRDVVADILADARRNGLNPEDQLGKACGQVMTRYYGKLFDELPERAGDEYDVKEVSRLIRAINRLGGKRANALKSMKTRFNNTETRWKALSPERRANVREIIREGFKDPFGY